MKNYYDVNASCQGFCNSVILVNNSKQVRYANRSYNLRLGQPLCKYLNVSSCADHKLGHKDVSVIVQVDQQLGQVGQPLSKYPASWKKVINIL